jgi:hypothetical protein
MRAQADMVHGLSVLELYMLVAVLRLQRRGAPGGASFARAHAEYEGLQRLHRTADACGRPAALRAFERLLLAGLLAHAAGRCVAGAARRPGSWRGAASTLALAACAAGSLQVRAMRLERMRHALHRLGALHRLMQGCVAGPSAARRATLRRWRRA